MWSLIRIIDADETSYYDYDVVPKKWIINDRYCLYPVACINTIKKLAKENTDRIDDWKVFSMVIIERDISDYERGYKMMFKANKKQSELNLESDFKKRGKGCRKKTASSRVLFDVNSSEEDNNDDIHPMRISSEIHYGMDNIFPIKSEDSLKIVENKLEDIQYFRKLVTTIAVTVGGMKSIFKMTRLTMRNMFSDEFIANYSWKGQKKKSLEASPIHKIIIAAIQHKFPSATKARIVKYISPWMAQSKNRIKRNASN